MSTVDRVEQLLTFPDVHPYAKWWGTHWRLVEIADAGLSVPADRSEPGVAQELQWLLPALESVTIMDGRVRRHASMEGNAVFALTRLGFADHSGHPSARGRPGLLAVGRRRLELRPPPEGGAVVVPRVGDAGAGTGRLRAGQR